MDWFTWGDLASILGVGLVAARLWDRGVKEAVANERRFTGIEGKIEQGRETNDRQDAVLAELRATNSKIFELLSEMKADIRVLKNGR